MISVFTPTHDPKYIGEALVSLRDQTYTDWEWIILCNNGAKVEMEPLDPRIKISYDDTGNQRIGYLKHQACRRCKGDILLELDHDDMLYPTALEEVAAAFEDPTIDFVYSNTVNHDVVANQPITWSGRFGWRSRPTAFREWTNCLESISAEPDPQSISRVWFAPNHLRAWRADTYWKLGGHDPTLPIVDDHDLMMRTWLGGKMKHIDKPLYFYRVHGQNTWLRNTDSITETMWKCHDKYIGPMATKWAKDKGLRAVDICSGKGGPPPGFEGFDLNWGPNHADLDGPWPIEDDSVGVLRSQDAIEHLRDPIHTMNEAWRVLAHGGFFFIAVPSTRGEGAWCDPTHRSFWNKRSFDYYTSPKMRGFIEPMAHCKFQAIKVVDGTQYGEPFVFAHLVAIKADSPRYYGENFWDESFWTGAADGSQAAHT
jgi:O-antigen biosynthesis protein